MLWPWGVVQAVVEAAGYKNDGQCGIVVRVRAQMQCCGLRGSQMWSNAVVLSEPNTIEAVL